MSIKSQTGVSRRGYKWIAKEIERLDPEIDYERIWELSTCFYFGDFQRNVFYSTGFPHFILPPWGGETIARKGTGKAILKQDKRENDTIDAFWTWFENGPSSALTKESVERVNRLHLGMEKKMPGSMTHNHDFVYTLCWVGADMHRLRLKIGLPGYTENQKIACQRFFSELAQMFWTANGDVTDFPADFEGMLKYMDNYEGTDWEYSPEGLMTCEAIIEQFQNRWFPKGLRWIGREMLIALWDEPIHRVHRIRNAHPLVRKLFEFGLKATFFTQERLLPDPKKSVPEKKRMRGESTEALSA